MSDEITNVVKQYNCPGIIARLEYDADAGATNVNLYLYAKTNGVNTYGTELFHTNGVAFVTNGTLKLHVTSNSASLIYNGTTYFNAGQHGVNISTWSDGGVCMVEAEDVDGNTQFAYLDNFKAWRPDASPVQSYEGSFTNAPDGMMLRAWMGDVAVYRIWSTARDTSTYVTNGRVMLIPDDDSDDATWLNARKDFQNELRLDVATSGVAEVRVALRDFTQGYAKIGLLPEYYSGFLFSDWNSTALYLEMTRSGGNINFRAYRTSGIGILRTPLADSTSTPYDNLSDVVVQVNSNMFKAYYGTNVMVNASHGITNYSAVYPHGLHTHIEFQSSAVQGYMALDGLKCRVLEDFEVPE